MRVLFVCGWNTCRSPMAENIFRHITKGNEGIRCASAGLHVDEPGQPMQTEAVEALKIIGIKARKHSSRKFSKRMASGTIVYDLTKFVPDPYGKGVEEYLSCAKMLFNWLTELYNQIKEGMI